MLPCKKILCPTDFSDASLEGLRAAVEMATLFSAELLLIHVQPPILDYVSTDWGETPRFDAGQLEQQQTEHSRVQLEELSRKQVPDPIRRRLILKLGGAAHEILETAMAEQVDLLVIATHGKTGWRRYLYGSVSQRVIQHAPCSVLAVRCAGSPPP